MRVLQVLTLLLVISYPSANADLATEFEQQFVYPLVKETPGAALVVVVDGQVVLQRVYGVRSSRDSRPITDQTLFRLASLSKTIAATAASILVAEDVVEWRTPLLTNLHHLRFKDPALGNEINLFHLMSQSTGLMPHAYTNLVEDNMSYQRIIKRLDKVDFVCPPGTCYGYQNVVFSLVGDLIEVKTDMTYENYVNDRIFEPLDMSRASMGLNAFIKDDNHAKPHVWTGQSWKPVRTTHHYYQIKPAAGVNASISDMRQWLLAQLGHKPDALAPALLDEMHRGAIKTTKHQAHYKYRRKLGQTFYGLGWRVFEYDGQPGYVHHGGYVKGMRSEMVFNRDLQTGMVFLTNSEPSGVNDLVFDFIELQRPKTVSRGTMSSVGR